VTVFPAFPRSVLPLSIAVSLGFSSSGCKTTEARNSPVALLPAPGAPASLPAKQKTADELFLEGTAAYESGQDDVARALFTEALDRAPQLVDAQYNVGVISERQGDLAQAAAAYQAALQIDRSHTPSTLNLGRIYLMNGEFEKAIAVFESAVQQPPKIHELALLNNLAAAYRLAKKYAKAEATSRAVLSKYGEDVDALKNLALVFYEQGQYRLAELMGINAEKINPKDPGIRNDLGLVYLKQGQRNRALAEFRQALALDPRFAIAHRNIGALALAYRDYPTAERFFAELVSLEPTSYEAHLDYAYALQGQQPRDPSKALAAAAEFEKALAIQRENPDAICGAGWAYSEDKASWTKALEYLEKCKSSPATNSRDRAEIEARQQTLAALMRSAQVDEQSPASAPPDSAASQAPADGQSPAPKQPDSTEEQRQTEDLRAGRARP
jgi:tetratricopeptide (TPR) repeat protein